MSHKIWCVVVLVATVVRGNELAHTLAKFLVDNLELLQDDALLDTNSLFGVAIVSGQLRVAEKYDTQGELRDEINKIKQLCDNIFRLAFGQNIAGIRHDKTQRTLLSPDMWAFDPPPTHFKPPIFSQLEKLETMKLPEFRNIYESCLRSLIEQCRVPVECFQAIIEYQDYGYILTHQILYVTVVKQVVEQYLQNLCFMALNTLNVDFILNEKCSYVDEEIRSLIDEVQNNETLIDLLIEEDVVCGLHNYVEFFQPKYIDHIINRRIPMNETVTKQKKQQLSMSSIIHLLSVRMAATALYFKHTLQEDFLSY